MSESDIKLRITADFLICNACGTQYPVTAESSKTECKICDDPRQFVPPEGQTFTTLSELSKTRKNIWWQDKKHRYVWSVRTEPSFAIGNRAELIQTTSSGNILWDLIPYLDEETVDKITELGGIKAIVISHPHYYSTWADWSRTFDCPVYVGAPDKNWVERWEGDETAKGADIRFLTDVYTLFDLSGNMISTTGSDTIGNIKHKRTDTTNTGNNNEEEEKITAILTGGHFPGSLLLHHSKPHPLPLPNAKSNTESNPKSPAPPPPPVKKEEILFIADTIVTVPSATNPVPGKPGVISFTFFWSIPNRIPLPPDTILKIWNRLCVFDFATCFGAFEGMDVYTMDNESEGKSEGEGRRETGCVKGRMLESCKIFVRGCGWSETIEKEGEEGAGNKRHAIFDLTL